MPDLQTALQNALIKTTLNAWDAHEDQIRKPQQENQMANPNPVITVADGKSGFIPSNNVMRATFEAVKNAPKMQIKEYIEMLACNGYKSNSVSSVLYQLLRAGQLARDDKGALTVAQDDYTPIKQPKKKSVIVVDKAPAPKPRQIVITTRKEPSPHGIAALKADSGELVTGTLIGHPPITKAFIPSAFIPSAIVDNLSVLHARELYDYLKKIFTGESK